MLSVPSVVQSRKYSEEYTMRNKTTEATEGTAGVFGIAEYVREEVAFVQVYVIRCSEKTTRFHEINTRLWYQT